MDLKKLLEFGRFTFDSQSLGKLLVHAFGHSALISLRKFNNDFSKVDSNVFVRNLMACVCEKSIGDIEEYTENRISYAEAEVLPEEKLNEFAKLFIEENTYLNKYSDEIKDVKSDISDINYCSSLKGLLHRYNEEKKKENKAIVERLSSASIYSKSVADLIKENQMLSSRFGNNIEDLAQFNIPITPENPVLESNRLLFSVSQNVRETSLLISSLNDLAVRMALEFTNASSANDNNNKRILILGLITLIVSVFLSGFSLYYSNVSSAEVNRVLEESKRIQIRTQDLISVGNANSMHASTKLLSALEKKKPK